MKNAIFEKSIFRLPTKAKMVSNIIFRLEIKFKIISDHKLDEKMNFQKMGENTSKRG